MYKQIELTMKTNLLKKLWGICICLMLALHVSVVHSQESSIEFNIDSVDKASLNRYIKLIGQKKSELVTIANLVGDIRDCHDQKLIYTSSGCVNPVSPESDPAKKAQAVSSAPITTCPTGHAHNWNGTSWSCKDIRKTVNSGVPSDTGTWQLANGESCVDHFGRNCIASDDTCPTTGNPMGVSCTPQPVCRYAVAGARNFMEFRCK